MDYVVQLVLYFVLFVLLKTEDNDLMNHWVLRAHRK